MTEFEADRIQDELLAAEEAELLAQVKSREENREIDSIQQDLAEHAITNVEQVPGLRERPDRFHEEPDEGPERENLEADIDILRADQKIVTDREAAEVHAELEGYRSEKANTKDNGLTGPPPQSVFNINNAATVSLKPSDDPFALVNAPGQNLIVLMRLYDVMMGLYAHAEPEKAEALMKIHDSGQLLLDYPRLVIEGEVEQV